MTNNKLQQIRLTMGYISGIIIGQFWYEYEMSSFLFTVSFRKNPDTHSNNVYFLFTKTINNVLRKVTIGYSLDQILDGTISKDQVVNEIYAKILKEIPEIEQVKLPVTDPNYNPGSEGFFNAGSSESVNVKK